MSQPITHGELQRAGLEANDLCAAFKFYPDGAVWERIGGGSWVKIAEIPRESDRRAFLLGRLDELKAKLPPSQPPEAYSEGDWTPPDPWIV